MITQNLFTLYSTIKLHLMHIVLATTFKRKGVAKYLWIFIDLQSFI